MITRVTMARPRLLHFVIPTESHLTRQVRFNITFLVDFFTSSFYLGNVYIADTGNLRVRKVTVSTGIITTIAGTGSTGSSGDNGPATSAAFNYPYGVTVDTSGNCSRQHSVLCY